MAISIQHDPERHRFYAVIENRHCFVDYEPSATTPQVIDIFRTFVHPDLRGKGIAEALLKSICDFAVQNGFSIKPTCSYAVLYFQRHPELATILAGDVDTENGGSCRLH